MTERPWFTSLWLALTATAYLLLADLDGMVRGGFADAVFIQPDAVAAEPWRLLFAPAAFFVSHDVVQFAFVAGAFALFVPWFEAREGRRRTAVVFIGAGLAGALVAVATLVAGAAVFPDSALLTHVTTRVYSGASTGAYAVAGAFAARLGGRARWLILAFVLGGEFLLFWLYFGFQELVIVFHVAAVAAGYGVTYWSWWRRLGPEPAESLKAGPA